MAEQSYDLVEASYSHQEVHQAAKESVDFLAAMALPEIYKYAFPDLYLKAWSLVTSKLFLTRDFSQIALGLPRGFAKTLVVKLLILYAILFTQKRFILVICENADKAAAILADVQDMLNESNIISTFGNWRSSNPREDSVTQHKKKFTYRGRDIIIKGMGNSGGVRGITENNRRPDMMIFDDIQSREDSESPLLSKQLETWMVGTAMKAKSPEGCLFLFIANMYPTTGSLLRKLKANPQWTKFIVGGILADGTSLWEELQPIAQLLREYANDCAAGQPQVFHSEVLNDENASVNSALSLNDIPSYPFSDEDPHNGAFIVIDPSNDKANSDAVSIGAFIFMGPELVFREVIEGKLSPGDTIREAFKMALRWKASLIVPEANAFQYSLKYWFEQFASSQGITGIQIEPIYSGSASKNSRILTMFKGLKPSRIVEANDPYSVEIHLHPDVRAATFSQINSFNPLKQQNVDGILDLLTYAPRIREEFGHYITYSSDEYAHEMSAIEMTDEIASSPF